MRFFSALTVLIMGMLVIATIFGEVDAIGVRKNDTMREEHSEISATAPKVVNRGKVKFQMPKSLMMAVAAAANPVARNRINRVRTTEAPNSIESDFSLEAQKVKTTTSKVIWWTSTTPNPISIDSLEQEDVDISLEMTPVITKSNAVPSMVNRGLPVNRFNRFRTTTVPAMVTRDSLERDDDDDLVLTLKATTPRAVNKPGPNKSRFNRVRTTTATPNLISRDSVELNDVSLEVVQVNPVLNRGRTVSRGQNKFPTTARKVMTMNRLNRTQTPATTISSSILADSKEVDISLEDIALTLLPTTQNPSVTTTEMTTTDEVSAPTTESIFKQSDERIDLSTEIDDLMSTQGIMTTTESEEVTTSAMPVTMSMQSDEWDDLDDIILLQTTTTTATTTSAPSTTAPPVVSRAQSRGRSRVQATTSSTNPISKVNRIRTTMAPKISRDSDEQNDSVIMAVLTSTFTTRAPVSKSRFNRVRTTTVRAPVAEESPKEVPAAPSATTIRNTVMGSRFSRFRTTTTTTTAVPVISQTVEKENIAPKRVPAPKKSRFGNVRSNVVRIPVSGDSNEKETILLGDVMKVNKDKNVVLVAVESEAVSQMVKTEPSPAVRNPLTSTRGRMGRGRTTTTPQPIASRHSGEENVSLEDLVFTINQPTDKMVQIASSDPVTVAEVQPMTDVSLMPITRHSDEQHDHVSLEQVDKVAVPVEGGLMVVDMDVSDEIPATTTLDPISTESTEKDNIALVMQDVIVSDVSPAEIAVDLPDISDEILPVVVPTTTTVNPISMESEELPVVVKPMRRKIVNRGRLNRNPIAQI